MAGVSVGTGAMGSLLGKLTALLGDEYNLLKRVRKEIEFLKRELGRMQVLLEKLADMEARLDGLGKSWGDSVRDLSYDMEDCIDRFMDRLGRDDAKPKFMKRTAQRLKTLWARHDIATQIKGLKARVMEESDRRDRYKLDESYYSATKNVEIDSRITTLHEEVNGLVALDDQVKHITALLMEGSMELKVVSIVGSGGLGKTTLAMEVYRKIKADFQCGASVSVSRTLDLVKLLKDILSQIDEDAYRECQSWEKEQLTRKIKQILTGKRVHDMVLDLIISLSDEENFATVLNGRICNSFPNKIRRLSMQSSGKENKGAVVAITETKIHVRSLTVFGRHTQIPYLVDFHALRVLDLAGSYFLENKHVKHIGSSCQLRYLRIDSCLITELPGEIGKLQHLETLDLTWCSSLPRLPSTVMQLRKLVRLFVNNATHLTAGGFRSLQALEELRFWETDDPVRFAEEVNELGKCNLRYLVTGGEIVERLFCNPCCTYPCLQVLEIESDIGMVPRGVASLENLVKLCVTVMEFDNEGFQVLMRLPSLVHLRLCVTRVIEEKLTIGSDGFKVLKFFHFQYVSYYIVSEEERTSYQLRLTFAPGLVPALRWLRLELSPVWVASDFFAGLGVEHLSVLAHLEVIISCFKVVPGMVEALECSVEKAIKSNPGHETRVSRVLESYMLKSDKEWEEAVSKKRKGLEELKSHCGSSHEERRPEEEEE